MGFDLEIAARARNGSGFFRQITVKDPRSVVGDALRAPLLRDERITYHDDSAAAPTSAGTSTSSPRCWMTWSTIPYAFASSADM